MQYFQAGVIPLFGGFVLGSPVHQNMSKYPRLFTQLNTYINLSPKGAS